MYILASSNKAPKKKHRKRYSTFGLDNGKANYENKKQSDSVKSLYFFLWLYILRYMPAPMLNKVIPYK